MKEDILKELTSTMNRLMTAEEVIDLFENILGEMSEERLVNILAEVRVNYS
jgi:hypothetical protein